MSFDNYSLLTLFLLFVFFIPYIFIRYRKSRQKAALFAEAAPSGERASLLKELRFRMIVSEIFFLFFLGFLLIALAGPRWGLRKVYDYRRGVDLILAFDLSQSMNVRDINPEHEAPGQESVSRLERGKQIALGLADSLGDIRIGIAIGKGKGVLAVPLTYDSETVMNFLYALDTRIITGTGTNLESLVNAAIGAFQDSMPSRRLIMLFSDGEGLSGSFQAAVERAGKAGVTLCAVGLGSDQGGPVPLAGLAGYTDTDFLPGLDGNLLISSRQDDLMRSGAERSGGIYVEGSLDDAVRVLGGYVNSIFTESRLHGQRWEANPRWRLFVFAAIFCLGAARVMGFSRRAKEKVAGNNEQ